MHGRCAAHKLNLIASVDISAAQNDCDYSKIYISTFQKLNSLWYKLKYSSNNEKVKSVVNKHLLTPIKTRWNSIYDSIQDLLKNDH